MKKATFTIASNPAYHRFDSKNPKPEIKGYEHGGYFGIHNKGDSKWPVWAITHIPTGLLLKQGMGRRKYAALIVDEMLIEFADPSILKSADPDVIEAAFVGTEILREYLISSRSNETPSAFKLRMEA